MTGLIQLAAIHDIPESDCRSFKIEINGRFIDLFVIHHEGQFHAYLNSCPHTGVNLEWQPNQFLDNSGQLIQCSTHGAKFRIEDGYCIFGPCSGASLQSIPLEIQMGKILIDAKTLTF